MGDKNNREFFATGSAAFNYNNVTGGADSASGGSGGSGMDCLQLRSPPGPFHYLISEQAKSLVALQELQNEVGALLEFRDLVIETFPNLRSKMAPSTGSSGESRREWEPGVRVRRKLAGGERKPQPSVQDSGFSTETSCGKDAHSSSASASTSRTRPIEDELWALLDVIQRKGQRLRDEAELVRGELERVGLGGDGEEEREGAEASFARALGAPACTNCGDLRAERDALLARLASVDAEAHHARAASSPISVACRTPLGRLDRALCSPIVPRVTTPQSAKFTAILQETNPLELQRQLLTYTVHNQVLLERLQRAALQRTSLLQSLERAREVNDDLKFQLDEKTVELESTKATVSQLEVKQKTPGNDSLERNRESRSHSSMRDMEPVPIPDEDAEARISETPRRRPSKIPLHTANKGLAPRPPRSPAPHSHPPRPPSAHSVRSSTSVRSRVSRDASVPPPVRKEQKPTPPLRRASTPHHDNKKIRQAHAEIRSSESENYQDSLKSVESRDLVAEYVARTERLAPLFSRLHLVRPSPELGKDYRLAYESPQNLALELTNSILYDNADSIDISNLKSIKSHGEDSLWNGKPQQYFESMNYSQMDIENVPIEDYDTDSLAP